MRKHVSSAVAAIALLVTGAARADRGGKPAGNKSELPVARASGSASHGSDKGWVSVSLHGPFEALHTFVKQGKQGQLETVAGTLYGKLQKKVLAFPGSAAERRALDEYVEPQVQVKHRSGGIGIRINYEGQHEELAPITAADFSKMWKTALRDVTELRVAVNAD